MSNLKAVFVLVFEGFTWLWCFYMKQNLMILIIISNLLEIKVDNSLKMRKFLQACSLLLATKRNYIVRIMSLLLDVGKPWDTKTNSSP